MLRRRIDHPVAPMVQVEVRRCPYDPQQLAVVNRRIFQAGVCLLFARQISKNRPIDLDIR